ncbi:protease inhibitor I42 family protein [uncultured Methylobacterium sp.]|jgi:predicted secreted protein|uniref:protease inhibitor I42 family protein n=1 Tax=uncultured Methylobacterium sp. TaxID=157278 RepID=UPI0026398356|nr:protease inhibitor I42 family protein [uncultured Methylobacterium sp.]
MPKLTSDRKSDKPTTATPRTPAQVGQSVEVEVRSGGATGFAWEPIQPLPTGVKLEKRRTVPDPRTAIGGMGRETLKFSFSQPGRYDLSLGFTSPSGQEVVEKKDFKFEVE